MSAAKAGTAKAIKAAALSRSLFIGIPHSRRLRDQPTHWLQFGCFAAKREPCCRICDSAGWNRPRSLAGRQRARIRAFSAFGWVETASTPVQGSPKRDRGYVVAAFNAASFPAPETARKPLRLRKRRVNR